MQTFELHVASSGELVRRAETDKTLMSWQKWIERKLLRYQTTPERVKTAILSGDTIAGWASGDAYQRTVSPDEMRAEIKRVFRGYDKWYEKRAEAQRG